MVKVKVFNWNSESSRQGMRYSLERFTDEVNVFLDSHKILSIEKSSDTQKVETWWAAGILQCLSYIVRYEDE